MSNWLVENVTLEIVDEGDHNKVGQGDESVRITRGGSKNIIPNTPSVQQVAVPQPIIESTEKVDETISGNLVRSPIVETFYRKPGPDKDPFIRVGDTVEVGDVLCIIEAMKMMNEIKSEFSGKITSINVEDGQPVEFDQHIITID